LDENDEKMAILRSGGHDSSECSSNDSADGSGGRVVKLAQCGLAWCDRFSFYDQIHTTGMDIKQHMHANAVITVGKDTTFRDFAQGGYRMRGLAKGQPQTLQLLLVPEVLGLVRKKIGTAALSNDGDSSSSRNRLTLLPQAAVQAVVAWLLLNSIQLESKQMLQLCVQNADSVSQRTALRNLLAHPVTAGTNAESEANTEMLNLTAAFIEPVQVALPPTVPVPKSFVDTLRERCDSNALVVSVDEAGERSIQTMIQLAAEQTERHSSTQAAEEWGQRDLDAAQTRTQEKEQEKEQEKQKQREVEREASPWAATGRDHDSPVIWKLADLQGGQSGTKQYPSEAFYPLAQFELRADPGKGKGKAKSLKASNKDSSAVIKVCIPPGLSPGQQMQVLSPSGQLLNVSVPHNVWPGQVVHLEIAPDGRSVREALANNVPHSQALLQVEA
jgi:hypothetical protein